MLKAQHELRVEGQQVSELNDTQHNEYNGPDVASITNFEREWASFIPFYAAFHTMIDTNERKSFLDDDQLLTKAREWHSKRDRLKELLFLAGEANTVVHRIPNWERLKNECVYIQDGNYLTPFSFILDFVNPIHMVVTYGRELWQASCISHEFMDYLSFKHPPIKQFWKLNE